MPANADLDHAAALLVTSERPLVVAGGGVVRSGAGAEVLELATRLDAPVATTYTGKGAFPERHPLAVGSAWDDRAHRDLVGKSDVVLCVGSWLGYEYADSFRELSGTLIQIDAAAERIGIAAPAVGLVGDAKPTVQALLERVGSRSARDGANRAAAVRVEVERGLESQADPQAVEVLRTVEEVLPETGAAAWDSTVLAYTACWYLTVDDPRLFLYPAGTSTLGYAWPAALGAAAANGESPVLAVVGDGGFQYGLSELATAKQRGVNAALLIVDDGGYGILREYQDEAEFAHAGVDLEHPDFVDVSEAYGIPARRSSIGGLRDDLEWALAQGGPAVVVLQEKLTLPQPSC